MGFFEFTPVLPIVLFFTWPALNQWGVFIRKRSRVWRVILNILSCGFVIFCSCAALILSVIAGPVYGPRFNTGHPYCKDSLVKSVERCEGRNFGLLQDRSSAVARYGSAVDNIEEAILSLPDYGMKDVPCSGLEGGFGSKCYIGSFLRETGDTNFMGVYIQGQNILVVETENVLLVKDPGYKEPHRAYLKDFLDIERFRAEMTP